MDMASDNLKMKSHTSTLTRVCEQWVVMEKITLTSSPIIEAALPLNLKTLDSL